MSPPPTALRTIISSERVSPSSGRRRRARCRCCPGYAPCTRRGSPDLRGHRRHRIDARRGGRSDRRRSREHADDRARRRRRCVVRRVRGRACARRHRARFRDAPAVRRSRADRRSRHRPRADRREQPAPPRAPTAGQARGLQHRVAARCDLAPCAAHAPLPRRDPVHVGPRLRRLDPHLARRRWPRAPRADVRRIGSPKR